MNRKPFFAYRSFQKERVEEIKKEVSTGALEVVNVTSKEKKAYAILR